MDPKTTKQIGKASVEIVKRLIIALAPIIEEIIRREVAKRLGTKTRKPKTTKRAKTTKKPKATKKTKRRKKS